MLKILHNTKNQRKMNRDVLQILQHRNLPRPCRIILPPIEWLTDGITKTINPDSGIGLVLSSNSTFLKQLQKRIESRSAAEYT